MRTGAWRWMTVGVSVFLLWGGGESASAQTIERFRFKAAADWWEAKRFEIRNPWVDPAVNVGGFRHAQGPVNRRGRVYLLGPGVTSPGEMPAPNRKSPQEIRRRLEPFQPKSKTR